MADAAFPDEEGPHPLPIRSHHIRWHGRGEGHAIQDGRAGRRSVAHPHGVGGNHQATVHRPGADDARLKRADDGHIHRPGRSRPTGTPPAHRSRSRQAHARIGGRAPGELDPRERAGRAIEDQRPGGIVAVGRGGDLAGEVQFRRIPAGADGVDQLGAVEVRGSIGVHLAGDDPDFDPLAVLDAQHLQPVALQEARLEVDHIADAVPALGRRRAGKGCQQQRSRDQHDDKPFVHLGRSSSLRPVAGQSPARQIIARRPGQSNTPQGGDQWPVQPGSERQNAWQISRSVPAYRKSNVSPLITVL